MDAAEYFSTLSTLLTTGTGYGKTQAVAAFEVKDFKLLTSTESGIDEVETQISVEPVFLVMDLAQYPSDYVQKLVVKDIMAKYALRIIGEGEINNPDFKGAGLWTSKKSSFEFDYNRAPIDGNTNLYDPDPEAFRVCVAIDKPIVIPTPWGKPFTIEAGGTLATRERDVESLASALADIKAGKISPKAALLNEDGSSKFDVYGMNPGFLEGNYQPVGLKETTQQITYDLSKIKADPALRRDAK
jgi:hypothetical protein